MPKSLLLLLSTVLIYFFIRDFDGGLKMRLFSFFFATVDSAVWVRPTHRHAIMVRVRQTHRYVVRTHALFHTESIFTASKWDFTDASMLPKRWLRAKLINHALEKGFENPDFIFL